MKTEKNLYGSLLPADKKQIAAITAYVVIYSLVFPWLYEQMGTITGAFSIVAVGMAGFWLGLRAGIAASFLIFLINYILFTVFAGFTIKESLLSFPSLLVSIAVACFTGILQGLIRKYRLLTNKLNLEGEILKEAIARREEVEEELIQNKMELQAKVKERTSEIEQRLRFERILTAISTRFIALGREEFNAGINFALESVCSFVSADRAYLILLSPSDYRIEKVIERLADKSLSIIPGVSDTSLLSYHWLIERFKAREVIALKNLDELPEHAAAEREFMEKMKIKSLINIPVYVNEGLTAILGLDFLNYNRSWIDEDILLLKTIGDMTAGLLGKIYSDDEIERSEKNFRFLFYSNPLPMFVYDTRTLKFLEVNDSCVTHYGYSREEFLSMGLEEIFSQKEDAVLCNIMGKGGQNNLSSGMHMNILKNGSIILTEMNLHTITYNGYKAMLVIARDVTVESRLERENNVLAQSVRSINECLCITDTRGTLLFVNDSFCKVFGYNKYELIGSDIQLVVPFSPNDFIGQTILSSGEGKWSGEMLSKNKNGESLYIDMSVTALKNEEGTITGLVAISEDITEKKRVQDLLKENEEFLVRLLDSVRTGIIEVDAETKEIVDINEFALKMSGRRKEDVKEKRCCDYYCPGYNGFCSAETEPERAMDSMETVMITADGRHIPVLKSIVPIVKNGRKHYIESFTDISNLKHAQDELRKYNQKLLELNNRLNESEQQLKEVIADKDKFFSIISHDLKSPFNSLLGFSDFILTDYDILTDEQILQFTQSINSSARSLLKLLENLLQWAMIQTGRMEYQPVIIDIFEITEQNINILSGNAKKKEIILENKISHGCKVFADMYSVNSVLQNLIANAIKFTLPGGTVSVSDSESAGYKKIMVCDTGVGMSEESLQKLFRIDVHHSTAGTSNESGTGLGLILCKEMVEKNGGCIWADSILGKGSTFTFTLPESRN